MRTDNITVTVDAQTGLASQDITQNQSTEAVWLEEPDKSPRNNTIEASVRVFVACTFLFAVKHNKLEILH